MAEYAFRNGARLQPGAHADPQIIGEHLAFLRAETGNLTADVVLADARNPNSPLHRLFEWDDGAAAEAYRRQQASGVIRSVIARYRDDGDGAPKTIRAFVSVVADDGKRHYEQTAVAMSDGDKRRQVIRKAWDELQAYRRKYGELADFALRFATLEEIEAALPPVITA